MSGRRTIVALLSASVVLAAILGWWSDWSSSSDRIAAAEMKIERLTWISAQAPRLRRELSAAANVHAFADTFLPAASDGEAMAGLQRMIREAVGGANGDILSEQPLGVTADAPFKSVSVRFQLMVGEADLVHLIYAIEQTKPYLFIDAADLSPAQVLLSPSGQPGDAAARKVTLQLDVHAFMAASSRG